MRPENDALTRVPYEPIAPPRSSLHVETNRMQSCSLNECIEGMPLGWFHVRLLIITGLGNMADGMEISLILFIGTCAGESWSLTSHEIALICSVVFGGEMAGSLFWGPLADYWGRRPVSLLGLAVISTFGILSAFSADLISLLVCQFFVGVGVGSSAVPFDLFAELLPSPRRGTYLVYLQAFFSCGAAFVVCIAWLVLSSRGWRYLVLGTAVPVLISLIFSALYLPESPRWLLCQKRDIAARQIIVNAAEINGTPVADDFELLHPDDREAQHENAEISIIGKINKLFNKDNLWLTIPLWMTWFCFGFGYYGVVVLVVRVFSENATAIGTPVCAFDYGSILANSSCELITVFILLFSIDYGRIRTMASFFCIAGVSVACAGFDISKDALFYIMLIARIAGTGSNLATWVATSELFPTELRATGHAFATAFLRFGSLIAPFLVESSEISLRTIGLLISAVFFCGLGCSFMLPETKGKQLDAVIKDGAQKNR